MRVVESVGVSVGMCVGAYLAYGIKVALNINLDILGDEHFPSVIERNTAGIIRCEWFPNNHHCKKK